MAQGVADFKCHESTGISAFFVSFHYFFGLIFGSSHLVQLASISF